MGGNRSMTHDELLAELDSQIESSKAVGCDCKSCDNAKALRAVVELHKPMRLPDGDVDCSVCENTNSHWSGVPYPCPTIQAITNRLGE